MDAAGGLVWPDGRCAFPGLRPLDVDEQRVFFGRRSEVDWLAGLLRSAAQRVEAAALVVGPSGCGKSSLVRAGRSHKALTCRFRDRRNVGDPSERDRTETRQDQRGQPGVSAVNTTRYRCARDTPAPDR